MKKRLLNVIISLIILSLLGIIIVQYFWIKNAVDIKEEQFNRGVSEAMANAVHKLETREDIFYMKNNLMRDSIHTLVQAFVKDSIMILNGKLDSLLASEDFHIPPPPPEPPGFSFEPFLSANQGLFLNYQFSEEIPEPGNFHYFSPQGSVVIPDPFNDYYIEYNEETEMPEIDTIIRNYKSGRFIISHKRSIRQPVTIVEEAKKSYKKERQKTEREKRILRKENELRVKNHNPELDLPRVINRDMRKITRKAKKIKDVIHKIAIELENKPLPIEKRVDGKELEKILKKSFTDKNITQPFEFSILSPNSETEPLPVKSKDFKLEYLSTTHRTSLFPNDIIQKPDQLLVFFPGQKNVLLRSLSWLMFGSVLFTLIIAVTSILSIFFMLRQKKISDIKTDFINNMTHEFKTPIATISVAVDSINNPKVIAEPEVIKTYTRVIKEENNRMNARVEQILQMALLDSSEFQLNKQPLDINLLVRKVANHFTLLLESRNGHLDVLTDADRSEVMADETHLSNVLINLLDNANKYSPEKPEIGVRTSNSVDNILITVQDKGIGMNPETRHKIFEKFFRVTSGNIHNVKGFGLGLSYSKAIILAHHGDIRVISEPGKGSTFEISLPLSAGEAT